MQIIGALASQYKINSLRKGEDVLWWREIKSVIEAACWCLKTSFSLVPGESQEPQVEVRRNKAGKKGMTARACVCESTGAGNCQGIGSPTEHTSGGCSDCS